MSRGRVTSVLVAALFLAPAAGAATGTGTGTVTGTVAATASQVSTLSQAPTLSLVSNVQQCEAGTTQWVTAPPPALARLAVPASWSYATGRGVTVAVIDSGIAAGNEHFPSGSVSAGRSFVGGSADTDVHGHGTAVAGIIAARPLQQSGVVGVAPGATLLPIRVYQEGRDAEELTATSLAEAITAAADADADIINISLSTPADTPALQQAVADATSSGALIIASGGSLATSDGDDSPRFPAAYPEVLGVSAAGDGATLVETAIPGEHIDLAAPATSVASTFLAYGDCVFDGRDSVSFATAYVSGVAALVAERFPDEGPEGWAARLLTTASREQRAERTDAVGWGIVAPLAALTLEVDGSLTGPVPAGADPWDDGGEDDAQAGSLDLTPAPDPSAPSRAAVWALGLAGLTLTLALALVRLLRR